MSAEPVGPNNYDITDFRGGIIMTPIHAYKPDLDTILLGRTKNPSVSFLAINEPLSQMRILSYTDGWSEGWNPETGTRGLFPTYCFVFDVVVASFAFSFPENPEALAWDTPGYVCATLRCEYISFAAGARILVEKRLECGWWIGAVIGKNGALESRGYFPGNHCKDLAVQTRSADSTPATPSCTTSNNPQPLAAQPTSFSSFLGRMKTACCWLCS